MRISQQNRKNLVPCRAKALSNLDINKYLRYLKLLYRTYSIIYCSVQFFIILNSYNALNGDSVIESNLRLSLSQENLI